MQDKKIITDVPGLIKKLAAKLFRILLWIIAITASIGALSYLFKMYGEHKELTYMTSDKCSTHDYQTQICEMDNGSLYLRRIEIDNNRMSISAIVDDTAWDSYRYGYWAFWFERCEEDVEIETDMSFSSGEPIMLVCDTQPNKRLSKSNLSRIQRGLSIAVPASIDIDSHGFVINHDYSNTDYSALLRRYALTATDVKKDRELRLKEEEARREKEAKEEKARREKEAKEEKAGREKEAKEEKAKNREIMACAKENKEAKISFQAEINAAREKMLSSPFSIQKRCESVDSIYSTTCERWAFTLLNITDVPISKVTFGYDRFKKCSKNPLHKRTISSSIAPGDSEVHLALWGVGSYTRQDYCERVLDVSFNAEFTPKNCPK